MIGFFPDPYPDELFHGMLCRLYGILGKPPGDTFLKMLFGEIRNSTGAILPKQVDLLVKHLPPFHSLTEKKIRDEHTLQPLYSIFTQERAHRQVEPRHLYSCPACRKKDRTQYGESYWHRSHQVPNGKTCYKHNIPLEKAVAEYRPIRLFTRRYFSPDDTEWCRIETTEAEIEIHKRFNGRIQTILNKRPAISPGHLITLAAMCQLRGFGSGRVLFAGKFLSFLRERLGTALVELYALNPDERAAKAMLSKVLRGTENSPYRYLLFYEAFDLGILETREMPPLPEKLAMPGKLPVKPPAKIAETQTRHRAAFLKLILDNPKACRGEIAALNKAATKWLRKYDKAWWVAQSARIRIGKRTNYKTCQEADLEALAFAEKAIAIDMSRDARPGVITVSHLAMLLPPRERHFLLVWGNQPRTQAFIAKYQDADVLEVYRKRIRWALLRVEGGKMGYRAFCELAGLKAAIRKYPEVDKMARDAIREIQ